MGDYRIEQLDALPKEIENLVHQGHIKDEDTRGIVCNYKPFAMMIKNSQGEVLGALQAYTAFAEIYVDDIGWLPSIVEKASDINY